MADIDTPIYKLNNGNCDYYPLTVASAVALHEPIKVKTTVGGFNKGDVITVATTIYEILKKLFGYTSSNKNFTYDKVTIKSNKKDEIYVNRDALFKLDNKTIKEDSDKTISVNIEELIDNKILVLGDDGITVNLNKLIDNDTIIVDKHGKMAFNSKDLVRVDNDGIIKDSHGRISFNRKCIRVDGKYITKNDHNVLCFNDKYLNNFDADFIIKNENGDYTINTSNIVTIGSDQVIDGNKSFSKPISVNTINFDNGSISSNQDGLNISGVYVNENDATSAVSLDYVNKKFSDTNIYLSKEVLGALNLVSCYEVQCNIDTIKKNTLNEFLNVSYSTDVLPGHIEVLKLRSSNVPENMNVTIDWGDGTDTVIRNCIPHSKDQIGVSEGIFVNFSTVSNEKTYYCTHVYPERNDKYVVTIYGNTYWGIHHDPMYSNLLHRVFESYLPICNCVKSLCSIAENAQRLLKINLPSYFDFSNVDNFSSAFKNCKNLRQISGFNKYIFTKQLKYNCSVFEGCENLRFSDCHLSSSIDNYKKGNSDFYKDCNNLNADLITMLPPGGFSKRIVSMKNVFYGCKNLICSDWDYVESILWGDTSRIWKDTHNCFSGCSLSIREHVPESWGGLKKIVYHNDVLFIRNMDDIYKLVTDLTKLLNLDIAIVNDDDIIKALKSICDKNKITVDFNNNFQLIESLEKIVVSLGADRIITLF